MLLRRLFTLLDESRLRPNPTQARTSQANNSAGDDYNDNSNNDSGNAARVIDESLREMDRVIVHLQQTKRTAESEVREVVAVLSGYTSRQTELRKRAKDFVQQGDSAAAQRLLAEQTALEPTIASYERIVENVMRTMQKLDAQIGTMCIQRDEVKAQRTVLTTQLASSRSQQEFLDTVRASGVSQELLERENMVAALQTELQTTTGEGTHSGINMEFDGKFDTELDAELAQLSAKDALAHLENELAAERTAKERADAEAATKRFHATFHHALPKHSVPTQVVPTQVVPTSSPISHTTAHSVINEGQADNTNTQRALQDFFTNAQTTTQTQVLETFANTSIEQDKPQTAVQNYSTALETDEEIRDRTNDETNNPTIEKNDFVNNFFLKQPQSPQKPHQ
jgi:phage shock protein A